MNVEVYISRRYSTNNEKVWYPNSDDAEDFINSLLTDIINNNNLIEMDSMSWWKVINAKTELPFCGSSFSNWNPEKNMGRQFMKHNGKCRCAIGYKEERKRCFDINECEINQNICKGNDYTLTAILSFTVTF